jgi:hypothetical protein
VRCSIWLAAGALALASSVGSGCGGDDGGDYWDGGEFAGEPVANSVGDLTEEAHDELEECGLSDDDASRLASAGTAVTETFDASGEQAGTLEVSQRAPAVVAFDCQPGTEAAAESAPDPRLEAMAKALKADGIRVYTSPLSSSALEGAVSGVEVTGEANGTVRVFASAEEATGHAEALYTEEALGTTVIVEDEVEFAGLGDRDARTLTDAFE